MREFFIDCKGIFDSFVADANNEAYDQGRGDCGEAGPRSFECVAPANARAGSRHDKLLQGRFCMVHKLDRLSASRGRGSFLPPRRKFRHAENMFVRLVALRLAT